MDVSNLRMLKLQGRVFDVWFLSVDTNYQQN